MLHQTNCCQSSQLQPAAVARSLRTLRKPQKPLKGRQPAGSQPQQGLRERLAGQLTHLWQVGEGPAHTHWGRPTQPPCPQYRGVQADQSQRSEVKAGVGKLWLVGHSRPCNVADGWSDADVRPEHVASTSTENEQKQRAINCSVSGAPAGRLALYGRDFKFGGQSQKLNRPHMAPGP